MNPISLTFRNFKNHKEGEISFQNIKSALIVGRTKENPDISNGVGKSSIYDAIEWVLYNKVHKTTIDNVVRDGTKKCEVVFSFEIGGVTYKIERSLTAKGTKNVYFYEMSGGEWVSITQRTPTETEEKILSVIRLSHKAFTYSVLFRQADLSGIVQTESGSETSSKSRVDILKEPLNLNRYSKKEKMAIEMAKPIKKEIETIEAKILALGNPKEDIKQLKTEIENVSDSIDKNTLKLNGELKTLLSEKNNTLSHLKQSLNSDDSSLSIQIDTASKNLSSVRNKIETSVKKKESLSEDYDKYQLSLKNKEKSLEEAERKLSTNLSIKVRNIEDIEKELKTIQEDYLKGSKILARLEMEREHAELSIPSSDHCPSCKQAITEEYRSDFTSKVERDIEGIDKKLEGLKAQLKKCGDKKNKIEAELSSSRQHFSNISSLRSGISSINSEITSTKEILKKLQEDIRTIESETSSLNSELCELTSLHSSLKERFENSKTSADISLKISSLTNDISEIEKSIEVVEKSITESKIRQGILNDRLKTRQEDLVKVAELNKTLSGKKDDYSIYQRVINSFSHKGIPTFIINTCLNDLQNETNIILKDLRPDLEVQFDADLNFTYRRNGKIRDYHLLSYGQKVYIALSFKKALARVIQRRMGVDIRFIEFDEVDSALDQAGVDALVTAIKRWQEDFKILVITHNNSLKDKFSHAILVEEGDDGSITKVVNSW